MTEFMGELAGVLIFLIIFLLMFYVITEMTAIYFTGKSIAENVKQRREKKKKKNKNKQNYYGCDCSSCKKRKVCMYSKTLDTYKDNAILYVSANSEATNDLFDLHVVCKQYEHDGR